MGGFFTKLFGWQHPKLRILLLGLDAAGKTTILNKLVKSTSRNTIPTVGFNVAEVEWDENKLYIWDVGGQEKLRMLWRHYYKGTNGVIFVIDSSDRERFSDVKKELIALVNEPELALATVLVVANKQDLPGHVDCKELEDFLELDTMPNISKVLPTVAIENKGLKEAMEWLINNIKS